MRNNYYPFGSVNQNRSFSTTAYRYGFNGKEKDDEVSVNGGEYDFDFRLYESRLGRFLSVDPLAKSYPWYSPYIFAGDNPIKFVDVEGLEQGEKYYAESKTLIITTTYKNIEFQVKIKFDANGQANSAEMVAKQETKNRRGTVVSTQFFKASVKIGNIDVFESNSLKISSGISEAIGTFKIMPMDPADNPEAVLKDSEGNMISPMPVLNQALKQSNSIELTIVGNDKILSDDMRTKDGTKYTGSKEEFTLDRAKEAGKAMFPGNDKIQTISAYDATQNTFKDNFPKTVPTTHKVGVELIIQKKTPSRPKYECFVSGTKITMNDGTTKSIEKLVIGDKILSVNLETMKIEDDEILEMVSPIHDEIVVLSFSDKTINSNTFDHPYYVESKGWCSYKPAQTKLKYELVVRQLEIGDKCYKYMDNKLVLVELKSMIEELGDVKTYNIASLKRNNVYFANSILVNNEKKTSRFTQEKIIDTLNCPINDGLYRYYINSSKETYLEGRVKNCNKDGVWHFYSSNSIRLLLEFKNGICYTEKTKSINSNTYLLSVQLNDTHDTLVLYDYNTKDLIESKKKYLIDKNNIPINASLSSENINFSKKLVYEMNIDYSPFASDLSIMSIKESDEQKHIITKYYRNYLSNQKTLIYEISGNNFIVGNKSSYYKLMKKELKYLKKEGER